MGNEPSSLDLHKQRLEKEEARRRVKEEERRKAREALRVQEEREREAQFQALCEDAIRRKLSVERRKLKMLPVEINRGETIEEENPENIENSTPKISENVSQKIPENIPESTSENISEKVSESVAENVKTENSDVNLEEEEAERLRQINEAARIEREWLEREQREAARQAEETKTVKLTMMEQLLASRPRLEPIVFGEETANIKRTQAIGSTEVDWKNVSDAKRRVKRPGQRPATTIIRPGKDVSASSGAKAQVSEVRFIRPSEMEKNQGSDVSEENKSNEPERKPIGMAGLLEEIRRKREKK
eukprot:TRINITY_DN4889_c0_g3_i1.p1 TRINITY_DN4889_c0_g3~~TRINITY_DN4889_c0_g3_i1.p1  ORF type:complete len:303 (-),score=88.93 TRINITY_DN4889_c0_g3_i1:107-1015(-)